MITLPVVGAVALLAAALLLIPSGIAHVRHPDVLAASLRRHRVVPRRRIRSVSRALGPAELVLGAATVASWVLGASPALGGIPVVLLYAAFGLYSVQAMRTAPGTSCACFGTGESLTWAVPARAGLLAAASLPALAVSPPLTFGPRVQALAAAVVVALLCWAIPVTAGLGAQGEHRHHRRSGPPPDGSGRA